MLQFHKEEEMKENNDIILFWIGSAFLIIAMLTLTVYPEFMARKLPYIYLDVSSIRSFSLTALLISAGFFVASKKTYRPQIILIFAAFLYYFGFIKLFVN